MKESKTNDDQFDRKWREQFDGFAPRPSARLFDQIQEKAEAQRFDQELKATLAEFEMVPDEKNWETIQPRLPLNLWVRVQLHRLSKIAAVFLVGMVAYYGYQQTSSPERPLIAEMIMPLKTASERISKTSEKTDFVFEIAAIDQAETLIAQKQRVEKRQARRKKAVDVDHFLAFILDEDDDFDHELDKETILESLRPVVRLTSETLTASNLQPLPRSRHRLEADLKYSIDIPLKVVEAYEVEGLIELYDREQRKK